MPDRPDPLDVRESSEATTPPGAAPPSDDRAHAVVQAWPSVIADLFEVGAVGSKERAFLSTARPMGLVENTVLVALPSDFVRDQIDGPLRDELAHALSRALGHVVQVALTVDIEACDTDASEPWSSEGSTNTGATDRGAVGAGPRDQPAGAAASGGPDGATGAATAADRDTAPAHAPPFTRRPHPAGTQAGDAEPRLNPKYTFDTFVIGASNRFAHAAAVAVAEAPAMAYNPLFIYGDSGLGKTHLLHAIGNYARSLIPELKVVYVSSEEFTNDFINSIRDDKAQAFQRRYRDIDVLLVDDIQFLQGKVQTQEEFFHTFNTLHNASKQIVVSSDQPPRLLEAFEERMRSRFEWGLLTDVQAPDLETRIAILRKKAALEDLTVPPDVLEYIASKFSANIRELEGALLRVTAFGSLNHAAIDVAVADRVLKDQYTSDMPEITVTAIQTQAAQYFDISIEDLVGTSRSRTLVNARQVAMYLCRDLTDLSLPKIGQVFGGRDHTTVMHAERKIRRQMHERQTTYNEVTELTSRLRRQARQSSSMNSPSPSGPTGQSNPRHG